MSPQQSTQFSTLFDNATLARIERLRINSHRRFTNRSRGEHLSGKGGSSTEFSDYRNYVEGDDVRFVDWNIFSRLHRPYLKLFHHEEELHVVILVDASDSMQFSDKLLRARQLAATFGIMGLLSNERVSCWSFNDGAQEPIRIGPFSGRGNLRALIDFVERIEVGGDLPIEGAIETMLNRHSGRGIVILLSDFLTFGDLSRPFNLLFSRGLEIFTIQILAPEEIDPDVTGDARFIDSETAQKLDVTAASDLLSIYEEHRIAYERGIENLCSRRNGHFLSLSSAMPLKNMLFDQLMRKGWIR